MAITPKHESERPRQGGGTESMRPMLSVRRVVIALCAVSTVAFVVAWFMIGNGTNLSQAKAVARLMQTGATIAVGLCAVVSLPLSGSVKASRRMSGIDCLSLWLLLIAMYYFRIT